VKIPTHISSSSQSSQNDIHLHLIICLRSKDLLTYLHALRVNCTVSHEQLPGESKQVFIQGALISSSAHLSRSSLRQYNHRFHRRCNPRSIPLLSLHKIPRRGNGLRDWVILKEFLSRVCKSRSFDTETYLAALIAICCCRRVLDAPRGLGRHGPLVKRRAWRVDHHLVVLDIDAGVGFGFQGGFKHPG
jgi:hypothetical protein